MSFDVFDNTSSDIVDSNISTDITSDTWVDKFDANGVIDYVNTDQFVSEHSDQYTLLKFYIDDNEQCSSYLLDYFSNIQGINAIRNNGSIIVIGNTVDVLNSLVNADLSKECLGYDELNFSFVSNKFEDDSYREKCFISNKMYHYPVGALEKKYVSSLYYEYNFRITL